MKRSSQILLIVASLMLIGTYFFPIWQIRLEAPQFPRGLFLQIELDDIHGTDEYMLNNINILNHYIGMHKINVKDFPELKIMPYIVAFLILTGLVVALTRRNKLLTVWLVIFTIFGVVGMYDFYSWEFAYGHDLNPRAPIKIPGMVYQPPLLGQKDLLNFRAFSFPYYGAIFLTISVLMGIFVNVREYLAVKKKRRALHNSTVLAIFILGVCLTNCSDPAPKPIRIGNDACSYCKMAIADARYGAELVTDKGKVYKYDSVECLINAVFKDQTVSEKDAFLLLSADYANPGNLTDARNCSYLHSMELPSPMGMFLTGFERMEEAQKTEKLFDGNIIGWNEAKELVLGS